MSLSQRIAAALDDVMIEPGEPARLVSAEAGPHRVSLRVRQSHPIAVEAEELLLETSPPGAPDRSLDELSGWANRIVNRVTYLTEPLALVETDASTSVVALRSRKPAVRGTLRSFDEVRLDASGRFRLTRHAFDETDRTRRQTPFTLSRDVLDRLIDDVLQTL